MNYEDDLWSHCFVGTFEKSDFSNFEKSGNLISETSISFVVKNLKT